MESVNRSGRLSRLTRELRANAYDLAALAYAVACGVWLLSRLAF